MPQRTTNTKPKLYTTPLEIAHPQSLQYAPTVCALAVSRVKVIGTPTATGGLLRASSVAFRALHFGDGFRGVLWRKRGVPCYAGTRADGLDVTHSVSVARAGCQTVGSGHPRTPCDPPRHASLSPCSALHTSTARHSPSRSTPAVAFPTLHATALHGAHLSLQICSCQLPRMPARF